MTVGSEPRTAEGRDMLAHSVQYAPPDADRSVVAAKIRAIEDQAATEERRELLAKVEALSRANGNDPDNSPLFWDGWHAAIAAVRVAIGDHEGVHQ